MRIKYTIICLLASMGIANAQFQNYVLKTPDNASKTYVGRDYVRLLPGYSFSASSGKAMNAKISSVLTAADANTFLAAANPTGSTNADALTAINTSLAVGQIPISSSVSPTGAKCYNVPIDIVPGRQGFQPNISLSYNSQAGNGVVGMGWNISGLSSIERVNKNIFFDGKNDVVNLSINDAFALDGVRLIEKSRTTSQINYETVQGYTMVTAYIVNNDIKYFNVQYPNGNIGIFGFYGSTLSNIDDTQLYSLLKLSYPIAKITDINGNTIQYNYSENEYGYNIYKIDYGVSYISFGYEERPDYLSYVKSTYSWDNRLRLKAIFNNNKAYYLTYKNNVIAGDKYDVSKLAQIDYAGFNPLKFYYDESDITANVKTTSLKSSNFNLKKMNIRRGKFDSNPQNDALIMFPIKDTYKQTNGTYTIVYPDTVKIKAYQNLGSDSSTPTIIPAGVGFEDIFPVNIVGSQADRVVKINSNIQGNQEYLNFTIYNPDKSSGLVQSKTVACFFNASSAMLDDGFNTIGADIPPTYYYFTTPRKHFSGNFTGRGKTEILSIPDIENTSAIYNSYPVNYNKNTYIFDLDNNNQIIYNGIPFVKNQYDIVYALDIDGDGQTELIKFTPSSAGQADTYVYKYFPDTGFKIVDNNGLHTNNIDYGNQVNFADVNGDGLVDIVKPNNYFLSGAYGYHQISNSVCNINSNDNDRYVMQDLDGDNIPELLVKHYESSWYTTSALRLYPITHRKPKESYLAYSTDGLPLFDPEYSIKLCDVSKNAEIVPVDINSNSKNYQLLVIDSTEIKIISISRDLAHSKMISLMVNSLGIADKTSYEQLYQGTNYTPGTQATFPNIDFVGPLWVATQNSTMYNKQLVNNNTYTYAGAILNKQGLGLRGFSSMNATDLMTNKVSTTEFDPYKMGAVTKQTSEKEELNFKYNFTDYDSSTGGNKKMKLLLTNKTVTDKLKGNTVNISYPTYDAYGNLGLEYTDFGNGITTTVANTYDNRVNTGLNLIGLLTNRITYTNRGGNSFNQTDGYEYDANNRLHYARKYIGSKMLTEKEYIYNTTYGTVSSETVHNIPTNDFLTTSYTYDNDNYSLMTKKDPQGLITTYKNDLVNRLLLSVTDYLGKTVTYGYDNWRRKNYELRPDGTTTNTTWAWNPDSSQQGIIMETQTSTGQPVTTLYTDALGRETRKAIVGFDGTPVLADKAYDNFGRLASTSAPYKSGSGALLTNYGYDEYDRTKTIVQPSGSTTSYGYSGNSVTENKDGVSVTKTTDVTGKLVSSQDAGGTVTYAYRPDGQPDNVNAAGVVTSFEYADDYNRQTKLIDPSAGTVGTVYDDAHHTVTQTWNSGKQIKTVSNKFGQPVTKTTPDFTTTYGYDTYARPTGSTSTNGTAKGLSYDSFGRLGSMTETASNKTYQEVYAYDQGHINNITYNTNTGTNTLSYPVVYKYNSNGYLNRLEDASGNRLREVNSVNAMGQETDVLLGNGLTTTKNYTPEGLWTNVKTFNSSSTWQNMSFDFNRVNGTLNSRTDNVHSGLTESFTYDGLYRLKNYGSKVVDYNSNGNIASKTDAGGYNYADASKPYTLSTVTNANADLTSRLNVDYTVTSRPTSIRNTTGLTAALNYNDAYDRTYMQIKQGATETMSKYYLGAGRYEIETAGGVEKQRLYLDGSPYTASILLEKVGGAAAQTYYLHRDYLGSITQITNNSGNLAAEYSYDAWGRMRNPANWNVYSATAQPTPMFGRGYTGHEHLNQFGLINMNARLYDPLLARFLAPDPFVNSGMTNDFNRYVYCRDNPLMYTDPSGKSVWSWLKRNIGDPFMREWNHVFGGVDGFEIGYNSGGGGFVNATRGGVPVGPVMGYNGKRITGGNYQGGFHNMSPVAYSYKLEQSVVNAEQNARSEYFAHVYASTVDFIDRTWSLITGPSEVERLYPELDFDQSEKNDNSIMLGSAGMAFSVGVLGEDAIEKNYKPIKIISTALTVTNTTKSFSDIFSGDAKFINYSDFGVGVADILNTSSLLGSRINPWISGCSLIYGAGRLGWDWYNAPSYTPYYPGMYRRRR